MHLHSSVRSIASKEVTLHYITLHYITLHSWLCFNGLSLNPDKSEAILFGTHQRLRTFPATTSIHISDTVVELSDKITSLGVVMDSNLTFNAHITALCKACHFHLRSL